MSKILIDAAAEISELKASVAAKHIELIEQRLIALELEKKCLYLTEEHYKLKSEVSKLQILLHYSRADSSKIIKALKNAGWVEDQDGTWSNSTNDIKGIHFEAAVARAILIGKCCSSCPPPP